ncbi:uncharacterized protein LOC123037679 [Drosophila rhopaloa]|uniref:Integrase catalytic domain-containing protein n=1 Tax=Drosophila rhopaloa TaxID=1041015 RepID=A0ABM5J902_DRORH|nr:uncharacterized protein LOC123037679 [Drosophila rhopaloa]
MQLRIFQNVVPQRKLELAKSSPSRNRFTVKELNLGTVLLLRSIQQVHLAKEYGCLSQDRPCQQKSKLISLRPIIGSDGLLRVGGRIQNASLDYDIQHPILLPKIASITWHIKAKVLANWRTKVRGYRHQQMRQMFSDEACHLAARYGQPDPAFYTTGVDYCGPFYHKAEARNKAPHKCYIAVFVCFSTKATHLEVVQDLTTDCFIAALRRFTSLRGTPRTIWSDNATSFFGAKSELTELKNLFLSEPHTAAIASSYLADGIDWKFIPPRAQHFGGLWEAAVKSAKFHFYRVVGASILGLDELRTLAYKISAILNSRPLCPISENAEGLELLTPAHFLKGSSYTRFPQPDITHLREGRLGVVRVAMVRTARGLVKKAVAN